MHNNCEIAQKVQTILSGLLPTASENLLKIPE